MYHKEATVRMELKCAIYILKSESGKCKILKSYETKIGGGVGAPSDGLYMFV
jgi:hypothetical protein